tara:strand:+ start:1068 stop:1493 length:426 start_codon:yes stop_codon:yes gene_type:complete
VVNLNAIVIFWSELVARPSVKRGLRSGEAPLAAGCASLGIDKVYAVEGSPLEPLVLVLMGQQSALSVAEPGNLPKLLATLWAKAGASQPVAFLWSHYHPDSDGCFLLAVCAPAGDATCPPTPDCSLTHALLLHHPHSLPAN